MKTTPTSYGESTMNHRSLFFQTLLMAGLTLIVGHAEAQSCSDFKTRLQQDDTVCRNVVTADVVALDQPFDVNRAGSSQPGGQMFALRSDVVPNSLSDDEELTPGGVMLRPQKRPRPMVLRVNEGDCLWIDFENLLAPVPSTIQQPGTTQAGVHVQGMPLVAACAEDADGEKVEVEPIQADGSFVGANDSSLAAPGESRSYVLYAEQEGAYMLTSTAANFGLINGNGQIAAGLHGSVSVEPAGAVWLRSQVTREQLLEAASKDCPQSSQDDDGICRTPYGQPLIDYNAKDSDDVPILRMIDDEGNIVATDLTAIIAHEGPDGTIGDFPYNPDDPLCFPVPAAVQGKDPSERCTQPFREIAIHYWEPLGSIQQAFGCVTGSTTINSESGSAGESSNGEFTVLTIPATSEDEEELTVYETTCPDSYNVTPWLDDIFSAQTALDGFGINYGTDGLGNRLLANRLRVGPQADCVACKFEEFFLASWANGDPSQISNVPFGVTSTSSKQPFIRYPDDPSNVYHSYIRDHVKFRIHHAGSAAAHVHHQHAHQWLHTPNADQAHYLDSQTITPGSSYTLEMVYDGSGNRNETVGDSIFHCHFYPHFAAGMWSMWRVHDVLEEGTPIDADTGLPESAWQCPEGTEGCSLPRPVRALPDGEIARGTPIPAIVPLPGRPMPPVPAPVALSQDGTRGLTLVEEDGAWKPLGEEVPYDPEQAREIGNPGYPFFIPGVAGQRGVRPPLDVAEMVDPDTGERLTLDGGLPRHLIAGEPTVAEAPDPPTGCTPAAPDNTYEECHTRFDFSKTLLAVDAAQLDEDGEPVEKLAMAWHGRLFPGGRIPSCTPEGDCDNDVFFRLNGSAPTAGAPFADPCTAEDGWNGQDRHYKAAAIQTDVVFNKEGWHYPQQRMLALWEDVQPTLDGERAPEPLFFRANSGECIDFVHANLVPGEYAMDDFQVRTPTDIIGQHIHLVKFDVTASDGAANGYNYEDATLSPDEVRERIDAINALGGLRVTDGTCPDGGAADDGRCPLSARTIPFFGEGPRGTWLGAMATVQRWIADPLEDNFGDDRTLRTVFTHDHLSPSTHQQAGLYAGLLVEPACSQWVDSWTGEAMGGSREPGTSADCEPWSRRPFDGGPTSWRANILFHEDETSGLTGVREFALEYQDIAHAYPRDSVFFPDPLSLAGACPTCPGPNLGGGIGPSDLASKFNTTIGYPTPDSQPGTSAPTGPWPQAVSFGAQYGTFNINYRSEPLPQRVTGADGSPPPAEGTVPENRDYAHVYRSIEREQEELNSQPSWYPPLTGGVRDTDPYTPLLEAYAGDRIQVRALSGAHFINHPFTIRGLPALFEPSLATSGYRATFMTGLSEHFELNFNLPEDLGGDSADYLYQASAAVSHQNKGAWGILRAYGSQRDFLAPLPDNPPPTEAADAVEPEPDDGRRICSPDSLAHRDGYKTRRYTVYALAAEDFVDGTQLPYYSPADITIQDSDGLSTLETAVESPEGLVYVLAEDVEQTSEGWALKPGRVFEPLVLRAAAGDCLQVKLVNHFDPEATAFVTDNPTEKVRQNPTAAPSECNDAGYQERLAQVHSGEDPDALDGYAELCAGSYKASIHVGLHPQLVAFEPLTGSGYNVGRNPTQTIAPGRERTYYWYAGHVEGEERKWTPVEFGAANLLSADPLYHHPKGLFGALIIEPEGSRWITDANTRLTATVIKADGSSFREGVLIFNDNLELYFKDQDGAYQALNTANLAGATGQIAAVGYGIEFLAFRFAPPALYEVALNEVSSDDAATASWGTPYFPDAADQSCSLASSQAGRDPATPILTAHVGSPTRIRVLHPMGNFTPQTFVLNGHGWQEEPYEPIGAAHDAEGQIRCSGDLPPGSGGFLGPGPVPQTLGYNPCSQWVGSQGGIGSTRHYDVVLEPLPGRPNGAGGRLAVPGDYLYRTMMSNGFAGGAWGIFRVGPEVPPGKQSDIVRIVQALEKKGSVTVTGTTTSILGSQPGERRFARRVRLFAGTVSEGGCTGDEIARIAIDDSQAGPIRSWTWTGTVEDGITSLCVVSGGGGSDDAEILEELPCASALATILQQASVGTTAGEGR